MINSFKVDSRNVHYGEDAISSTYEYQSTDLQHDADGNWTLKPLNTTYHFRTGSRVPKLGWALKNWLHSAKRVVIVCSCMSCPLSLSFNKYQGSPLD